MAVRRRASAVGILFAIVVPAVSAPPASSAAPSGLVVSASPDQSNRVALKGATLSGRQYIAVAGYPRARSVRFSLDGRTAATRFTPFAYAGMRRGKANALDTTTLTDGRHTLRATVTRRGGVIAHLVATFTVANQHTQPVLPMPSRAPASSDSPVSPASPVAPAAPSAIPGSPAPPPPLPPGARWTPTPGTTWQWQLTGALDTTVDASVYDVDGFDMTAAQVTALHAQGRKVICYLSVGTWENWRPDAALFPASVKGSANGWPGEQWLDVRRIDLLAPIMTTRFRMCRDKGFDAVEPDNVDGYANSTGFPLGASDQATFNRWVADTVHSLGMSVGLKNDVDQVTALQPSFDWALNEQCFQYAECGSYASFVASGKAVFIAEYQGNLASRCPIALASGYSLIMKRLSLDAWRQAC
jgi:hypothetical protein